MAIGIYLSFCKCELQVQNYLILKSFSATYSKVNVWNDNKTYFAFLYTLLCTRHSISLPWKLVTHASLEIKYEFQQGEK